MITDWERSVRTRRDSLLREVFGGPAPRGEAVTPVRVDFAAAEMAVAGILAPTTAPWEAALPLDGEGYYLTLESCGPKYGKHGLGCGGYAGLYYAGGSDLHQAVALEPAGPLLSSGWLGPPLTEGWERITRAEIIEIVRRMIAKGRWAPA